MCIERNRRWIVSGSLDVSMPSRQSCTCCRCSSASGTKNSRISGGICPSGSISGTSSDVATAVSATLVCATACPAACTAASGRSAVLCRCTGATYSWTGCGAAAAGSKANAYRCLNAAISSAFSMPLALIISRSDSRTAIPSEMNSTSAGVASGAMTAFIAYWKMWLSLLATSRNSGYPYDPELPSSV